MYSEEEAYDMQNPMQGEGENDKVNALVTFFFLASDLNNPILTCRIWNGHWVWITLSRTVFTTCQTRTAK